jgi:large subunit ribosomal protein L32
MGLPGHRRTSSHKRRRASHFALKKRNLAACPKCNEPVLPHRACLSCGTYAGRQVIAMKDPLSTKKNKKQD